MRMAPEQDFWAWFEVEMTRQGYRSVRQVERAGRVGNDTISGRQRSGLEPTYTIIRAIAAAFGMSFEEVEEVARTTESAPTEVPPAPSLTLRELWGIVSEMPVEDQRAVLDYALFRRSRSDEREEGRQGAQGGARPEPGANP
jgi:hypothetical protein